MKPKIMSLIGLIILIIALIFIWNNFVKPKTITSTTPPIVVSPTMTPATNESPAFVGTIWSSLTIANQPILPGTTITAQFNQENQLTGSDGCNTFSTNYTINGTNLTIDPAMVSSKKACDEAVMSQADAYIQALLATTSYTLGDGLMVLNQNNVPGLEFTGQTNSLSKTSWDVTGYNNGKQAVVSPVAGTNLTLVFGDDGTISGNSGCNTFSGQYTLNGQNITLTQLTTTMRACIEPEGVDEQETAFLTALKQAATWNILGNQLSLRTAQDSLAVTAISPPTNPSP